MDSGGVVVVTTLAKEVSSAKVIGTAACPEAARLRLRSRVPLVELELVWVHVNVELDQEVATGTREEVDVLGDEIGLV